MPGVPADLGHVGEFLRSKPSGRAAMVGGTFIYVGTSFSGRTMKCPTGPANTSAALMKRKNRRIKNESAT